MENNVLVTGGGGLIGSEFKNVNKVFSSVDLRSSINTDSVIKFYSPKYVIHTAGKVGGLGANMSKRGTGSAKIQPAISNFRRPYLLANAPAK